MKTWTEDSVREVVVCRCGVSVVVEGTHVYDLGTFREHDAVKCARREVSTR